MATMVHRCDNCFGEFRATLRGWPHRARQTIRVLIPIPDRELDGSAYHFQDIWYTYCSAECKKAHVSFLRRERGMNTVDVVG